MQTFLPYSDFDKSANCLDYRRLGKQRVETKQIYLALTDPNYGWQNHPAVKMWRGYEDALALYGLSVCVAWTDRGYKDSLTPWFEARISAHQVLMPKWLGNNDFHISHQSNLVRKDINYYSKVFGGISGDLPYIWPVND